MGRGSGRGGNENRGDGGSRRLPRVEREIQQVIGSYLLGRFRGQLHGLVSVSRVIVSADLRTAKVLVTVMGTDQDRDMSLDELKEHTHEIQSEVNRQLQMKFCPRLSFFYDDGFDNALKVERILRDIGQEREGQKRTSESTPEPFESDDEGSDD